MNSSKIITIVYLSLVAIFFVPIIICAICVWIKYIWDEIKDIFKYGL